MPACQGFADLLRDYAQGRREFRNAELDVDPDNVLDGECLDGIDLSHSFVVASFRGASLRNTAFVNANVKTCDFTGADLYGADFRGALLCATTFVGAKMDGARFGGASIHSHVLAEDEQPNW